MIYVDVRDLVYHHLQPFAQAVGCKLFIADKSTHNSWQASLEKKVKALQLDPAEIRGLYEALEDYGCIAILKSREYLGAPEIAPFFKKLGLKAEDIHYLQSSNAAKHPVWGDLDVTIPKNKRAFLYWFSVDVVNGDGGQVFEKED